MKRDVFQAIADPTRRAILVLLAVQAMTPNAIAEHFISTRQAISKHIHILVECELLSQQQQGREIYYHFNPTNVQEVDKWLQQLKDLVEKRFTQLDDVLTKLKTQQK
ncbi:metalloregulator ArsR/SmtB family transcription factor [Spirosoma flavum]|uniref:Metalloregulator ArsR/SmtB family transcription factor n=1 Tax=Spirosoma flavum TaxID=2048557 RepID=A0ABW6ASC4_9BACT